MRVQVKLSDDLVQQIDTFSKKVGVSRSSFCAMLIGQGVMTYSTTSQVVEKIGALVSSEVKELLRDE